MKKKSIDYNRVIYSINVQDIQTVAEENFGRELTAKEIEKIEDRIGDGIPWYDVIYGAIKEKLEIEESD